MEGSSIIYFVIFIFLMLGIAFFISGQLTKRAIFKIIRIFGDENALSPERAKTIAELGLTPPSFIERIGRPRDYRQNALKILIKAGVVQLTEDGRLFIPENKINELRAKGVLK